MLGESKWHRSAVKWSSGAIELPQWQTLRHCVFRAYVRKWMSGQYDSWEAFHSRWAGRWRPSPTKPLAPPGSLLALNLTTILAEIRAHFSEMPCMMDVCLYLHYGTTTHPQPDSVTEGFKLVPIDCEESIHDGFIRL